MHLHVFGDKLWEVEGRWNVNKFVYARVFVWVPPSYRAACSSSMSNSKMQIIFWGGGRWISNGRKLNGGYTKHFVWWVDHIKITPALWHHFCSYRKSMKQMMHNFLGSKVRQTCDWLCWGEMRTRGSTHIQPVVIQCVHYSCVKIGVQCSFFSVT